SLDAQPWLADHAALGTVLFPGTGLVELGLHAGHQVGCDVLEELTLEAPLVLPETGGLQVQVVVDVPDGSGRRALSVHWRPEGEETWTRHASGLVTSGADGQEGSPDLAVWPPAGAQPVDLAGWYGVLAGSGYGYGPTFQGLRAAWRRGDEVFAELALAAEQSA